MHLLHVLIVMVGNILRDQGTPDLLRIQRTLQCYHNAAHFKSRQAGPGRRLLRARCCYSLPLHLFNDLRHHGPIHAITQRHAVWVHQLRPDHHIDGQCSDIYQPNLEQRRRRPMGDSL